ncbi:nitroreductase family protein [Akkermansiaceae bacterium]|nr:nitroreductase family protein [Akkermansiaceae bacterium]MDB4327559.1 nitroreductase family protein [bacterium]MDB4417058.1 nitroreductase family protein [Akkermansiaceae bacterium]MDB4722685.1 nitroreductase family protein [Akkermansiaceae bacterium]MDB4732078.1 nitroreductase family protein [bacterium]
MDSGQLEGRIIATYHVIEKGLSMPEFRPAFGVAMLKGLIKMLQNVNINCDNNNNINIQSAKRVVFSYVERHEEIGYCLKSDFTDDELKFANSFNPALSVDGGVKDYNRTGYFEASNDSFSTFAKSRHSCRVFDPAVEVNLDTIRAAVDVARYAPSVCNRQCWRAHVFRDRKIIDKLLEIQEGNRGFGHTIPCVVVLTAGVKVFSGYAERSQGFLDGGLFGMSLMYALHHFKLGCVPLCWLVSLKKDSAFRKIADIPGDEIVLMLLGVGTPVTEFSTPASQRREVDELVRIH